MPDSTDARRGVGRMQCGVGDQCAGAGKGDRARRQRETSCRCAGYDRAEDRGTATIVTPSGGWLDLSFVAAATRLSHRPAFPLCRRSGGIGRRRHRHAGGRIARHRISRRARARRHGAQIPCDVHRRVAYPLHLAISADWKVHYFTAAMAKSAAYRAEERRFLDDMPAVLGARAMAALAGIGAALRLDYAGVDFALAPDGSVLLFEANATMVIVPPNSDPIWDYRPPRRCRRFGGCEADAVAARRSIGGHPFTCWISFAQRSSTGSVASAFTAGRLTLTRTAPRSR